MELRYSIHAEVSTQTISAWGMTPRDDSTIKAHFSTEAIERSNLLLVNKLFDRHPNGLALAGRMGGVEQLPQ